MVAYSCGWLGRLADRVARERSDIGRPDDLYLTRWRLLGRRYRGRYAPYLHHFHRSDPDHLHDHPWPFVSVILAGGYWEVTPRGRRWYAPGRVLIRPAAWRHRVELPPGRDAWTLILRGPKERAWGFYCPAGFVHWREYVGRLDAGAAVCG